MELGLDTTKKFLLVILVVAVIGFLVVVIASTLQTASYTIMPDNSINHINDTYTIIGYQDLGQRTNTSYILPVCGALTCVNSTDGESIGAGNWTQDNCIITGGVASGYNNTEWKCTYIVTHENTGVHNAMLNISDGSTRFFDGVETWFTLLSVVIIILIISVVIWAVGRFGGGEASNNSGSDML